MPPSSADERVMEREHEALAGAAEHEALSSDDPSSPASLRYAAGVVSTQRVSSAVAVGRRALKAVGGAEGASSATGTPTPENLGKPSIF